MGVWLNYYAARMRLERELGTMKLNQDGGWMDHPVSNSSLANASGSDSSGLPLAVPSEWIELADSLQQEPDALPTGAVEVDARDAELIKEADHVD